MMKARVHKNLIAYNDNYYQYKLSSPTLIRMAQFSKQYEAFMRNQILTTVYGSLPSYCVWTEDNILDEDAKTRMDWWRKMVTEATENKIDVEKKNESHWPFVSIREYAIKWVNTIKKENKKETELPSSNLPLSEFCSKRDGWHLSCDI